LEVEKRRAIIEKVGYMMRARSGGVRWMAVVLGWVIAIVTSVLLSFPLNLVDESFVRFYAGPLGIVAVLAPIFLSGFLAYLAGGLVAGRVARSSGGLNGAMTAVVGLVVGVAVLVIGVSVQGQGGTVGMSTAIAGAMFTLPANLLGGYLGGRWGESLSH
jgi:hypothetical protein